LTNAAKQIVDMPVALWFLQRSVNILLGVPGRIDVANPTRHPACSPESGAELSIALSPYASKTDSMRFGRRCSTLQET